VNNLDENGTLSALQRKLRNEMNRFMGSMISKVEILATSEFSRDNLRKQILDEGNEVCRQMEAIFSSTVTQVKLPIVEYRKMRKDAQARSSQEN